MLYNCVGIHTILYLHVHIGTLCHQIIHVNVNIHVYHNIVDMATSLGYRVKAPPLSWQSGPDRAGQFYLQMKSTVKDQRLKYSGMKSFLQSARVSSGIRGTCKLRRENSCHQCEALLNQQSSTCMYVAVMVLPKPNAMSRYNYVKNKIHRRFKQWGRLFGSLP